jgi:hypothetical protein
MTESAQTTVTRSSLEEQIVGASEEVDLAKQELEAAEDRLTDLEEKLKQLPPDGADAELFYARRDPRQLHLEITFRTRRKTYAAR